MLQEELSFCFNVVTAGCREQTDISSLASQGLLDLGRPWYNHGNHVV